MMTNYESELRITRIKLHAEIDDLADMAKVEIIRDVLKAMCHISGLVSHHIRSMAQLRRIRVADNLNKR